MHHKIYVWTENLECKHCIPEKLHQFLNAMFMLLEKAAY